MDQRDIAEWIVKNNPVRTSQSNCAIKAGEMYRETFSNRDGKMDTEEKIKELEAALKCGNDLYEELSKIIKENNDRIKGKTERLKKDKYELYKPNFEVCFSMSPYGDSDRIKQSQLERCYNYFKNEESADYYAKQRQIFDALANFSAHNDHSEKDQDWNGVVAHWCILKMEGKWAAAYEMDNYGPTTVYFSTKELVEAALEMLKRENLI